jgi:response regulator RpfG family c-di-GMP phosphodiesterase
MTIIKTFEQLVSLAPQHVQDELTRLKTYEENSQWHPEDNTFEHVKIVVDRLITTGDIDLIMSGLYHDIGKLIAAEKTLEKQGKFRAFGHEHVGAKWVRKDKEFIESMGADSSAVEEIVANHMRMKQMDKMGKKKVEAMKALPTYSKLCVFTRADNMLEDF